MTCKVAHLTDRSVIAVSGPDAKEFLQGLITNDMDHVSAGQAIHAGLLTPQGKLLFDFFVCGPENDYLIECASDVVDELQKRLTFYRLRAALEISDWRQDIEVWAVWGGQPELPSRPLIFQDPRLPELGYRMVLPRANAAATAARTGCTEVGIDDYHAHRVALAVPESGRDYALGDTFPHEANLDQLGGVDFQKGCFVGQEVISRMHHRGTARKRVVPVSATGPLPPSGTPIMVGTRAIGTLGSVCGSTGLGLVRLDRAKEALDAGEDVLAGGMEVRFGQPDWATFSVPN